MDYLRGKMILIADADQDSREAISAEFRRAGCEVFVCSGGIEAYEMARDKTVHALIASDHLSSGDPEQLLNDVRRLHRDIPLILFGTSKQTISQTQAINLGCAAYFRQAEPVSALVCAADRCLSFVKERHQNRTERVGVAGYARFTYGQPQIAMSAPILNLSKGGMFLQVEKDFPPQGAMVVFQISFANEGFEPAIEGVAVIRWVRESARAGMLAGVGLEFSVLSPEAQAALKGYLIRTSKVPVNKVG